VLLSEAQATAILKSAVTIHDGRVLLNPRILMQAFDNLAVGVELPPNISPQDLDEAARIIQNVSDREENGFAIVGFSQIPGWLRSAAQRLRSDKTVVKRIQQFKTQGSKTLYDHLMGDDG
jgi:hypothetical protein